MELTECVRKSLIHGDMGYDHITIDMQNDIINFDFKGEGYRLIVEKVEG